MTMILLVEDNIRLAGDITLELELHGYDIWLVTSGQRALDTLQSAGFAPDIIVSEMSLPDMDGCALLRQVRDGAQWPDVPVLFLSAFNVDHPPRNGQQPGSGDYIEKPFRAVDLVNAIEAKLKGRSAMG